MSGNAGQAAQWNDGPRHPGGNAVYVALHRLLDYLRETRAPDEVEDLALDALDYLTGFCSPRMNVKVKLDE